MRWPANTGSSAHLCIQSVVEVLKLDQSDSDSLVTFAGTQWRCSSAELSLRSRTILAFPSAMMPSVCTQSRVIIVALEPVVTDHAANDSFDYEGAEPEWLGNEMSHTHRFERRRSCPSTAAAGRPPRGVNMLLFCGRRPTQLQGNRQPRRRGGIQGQTPQGRRTGCVQTAGRMLFSLR